MNRVNPWVSEPPVTDPHSWLHYSDQTGSKSLLIITSYISLLHPIFLFSASHLSFLPQMIYPSHSSDLTYLRDANRPIGNILWSTTQFSEAHNARNLYTLWIYHWMCDYIVILDSHDIQIIISYVQFHSQMSFHVRKKPSPPFVSTRYCMFICLCLCVCPCLSVIDRYPGGLI